MYDGAAACVDDEPARQLTADNRDRAGTHVDGAGYLALYLPLILDNQIATVLHG